MKKTLLIILAVGLGLCLLGAGGLAVFLATLPSDTPAFDDSHLLRPTVNIGDDINAFAYYTKAANDLAYPEDRRKFDKILEGQEWDDVLVQAALDHNSRTFAFVAEGNRHGRCLSPRITSYDALIPYVAKWRNIARLFVVKISSHIRHKQAAEALSTVTALLQFSQRIQADAGSLVQYLVSVAIREMCMSSARDLIRSGLLNDSQLVELRQVLESNPPSTRGYVLALQTEYERCANYVDTLHAGRCLIDGDQNPGMPPWLQRAVARHFLHPNSTKRIMGMIYAEMTAQATNCFAGTRLTDMDRFVLDKKAAFDNADGLAKLRVPNPVGTLVYALLAPAAQGIVKRKCDMDVSHRATLLLAALERFKNDNNVFPDTLAVLVPDYIPEVPADPYDGKPMRYSHARGIVYSVGADLKDSGGSSKLSEKDKGDAPSKRRWKAEDILFEIKERIEPSPGGDVLKAAPQE